MVAVRRADTEAPGYPPRLAAAGLALRLNVRFMEEHQYLEVAQRILIKRWFRPEHVKGH